MNKYFIAAGISMLLTVGFGFAFYLYSKPHRDTSAIKPEFSFDARDLYKEYRSNETAANKKLVDKVIEVKGTVSDMQQNDSTADILLDTGDIWKQQQFRQRGHCVVRILQASFSGSFTGDIDLKKDGVYPVMVKGRLSLHNTTQNVTIPATLEVKAGQILGQSQFNIKPEDYHIDKWHSFQWLLTI